MLRDSHDSSTPTRASASTTRLLCLGDLHLGRIPHHIPEFVRDYHLNPAELGPRTAWFAAVEHAIAAAVDAVLLAGDLVDQENHYFEGLAPLSEGVERLVSAGIQVIAVAGNHDAKVLPVLAEEIPDLKLLGRNAEWEWCTIGDTNPIDVVGWSFPAPHHDQNPLANFERPSSDRPSVGLLHCDLDQTQSRYAPVKRAELTQLPVSAWCLGHIHKADAWERNPVGYLGSVVGLDRTEVGPKGAWQLEFSAGKPIVQFVPVAPLLRVQEQLELDEEKMAQDLSGLRSEISRVFRKIHESRTGGETTRLVLVSLELQGRIADHQTLKTQLADLEGEKLAIPLDGTLYAVGEITDQTRTALDLEQLAQAPDLPGLLARQILDLTRSEMSYQISADLETLIREEYARNHWDVLDPEPPSEGELVELAQSVGLDLLEQLLGQRANSAAYARREADSRPHREDRRRSIEQGDLF